MIWCLVVVGRWHEHHDFERLIEREYSRLRFEAFKKKILWWVCHRLDNDNDVAWPPNHACLRHGMMPCGRLSLTWTSWSAMILSVCKDVKRLSSSMKIVKKDLMGVLRRDNDSDVAWAPNHARSRHDIMPCGRWSLTWTSWFWASYRMWNVIGVV